MEMQQIIIVPYRNREAHLAHFLDHMHEYYENSNICIVEQSEDKPFNRGKLLNIGFLENELYNQFIFHDVDMLPQGVNYNIKYHVPIVQFANSAIQLFDYLGGVTRFSKKTFRIIGGYHNDFYHRAEDNEMSFNLKRLSINVIRKPGNYQMLPHTRVGPEFDPALWQKAQRPREIQNQLKECKYAIKNERIFGNVRHITVEL